MKTAAYRKLDRDFENLLHVLKMRADNPRPGTEDGWVYERVLELKKQLDEQIVSMRCVLDSVREAEYHIQVAAEQLNARLYPDA